MRKPTLLGQVGVLKVHSMVFCSGIWLQITFQKEVVDIYSDIIVVEGQIRRAHIPKGWVSSEFQDRLHTVGLLSQPTPDKVRPALLKETEEGFAIWHNALQWPLLEPHISLQKLDKTLIQDGRNALRSVMSPEQHTQEITWFLDQFWGHFEHIPQDKIFGGIIA